MFWWRKKADRLSAANFDDYKTLQGIRGQMQAATAEELSSVFEGFMSAVDMCCAPAGEMPDKIVEYLKYVSSVWVGLPKSDIASTLARLEMTLLAHVRTPQEKYPVSGGFLALLWLRNTWVRSNNRAGSTRSAEAAVLLEQLQSILLPLFEAFGPDGYDVHPQ